jgi:hypothetical protein
LKSFERELGGDSLEEEVERLTAIPEVDVERLDAVPEVVLL